MGRRQAHCTGGHRPLRATRKEGHRCSEGEKSKRIDLLIGQRIQLVIIIYVVKCKLLKQEEEEEEEEEQEQEKQGQGSGQEDIEECQEEGQKMMGAVSRPP